MIMKNMKETTVNKRMSKKFLPFNRPDVYSVLEKNIQLNVKQKDFLDSLSREELIDVFFIALSDPQNVTMLVERMIEMGFDQNNMIFDGISKKSGDQLSICRWLKAASGAIILVTRYNYDGELEILLGRNRDIKNLWVIPGGHYELDDHKNLEHTMIAELMEETGIIPLSDEFLPYIKSTLELQQSVLPYKSLDEAKEFTSNKFFYNLENVISGVGLGYGKRIIQAVYRIHFHDGLKIKSQGSDDLEFVKWLKLRNILPIDQEAKTQEEISLNKFIPGHQMALKGIMKKLEIA